MGWYDFLFGHNLKIFLTKYLPTTSQNVYAWTSIYLELRMIKLGHYLDAAVELKVF